jgi:hypothetical protein
MMKISEVKEILEGKLECGEAHLNMEVESGCGCDLMSHVLAFVKHDNTLLLTGLTSPQTIYIADAVNIKAICFVRGKRPLDEMIKLAKSRDMVLLSSDLPMYEACGQLFKHGLGGCSEYDVEK